MLLNKDHHGLSKAKLGLSLLRSQDEDDLSMRTQNVRINKLVPAYKLYSLVSAMSIG